MQNGTVLLFDMRQTARHVESLTGLTGKLVHTLHSLSSDSSCSSGIRSVLTASALGLCQLNFGRSEERYALGAFSFYGKSGITKCSYVGYYCRPFTQCLFYV